MINFLFMLCLTSLLVACAPGSSASSSPLTNPATLDCTTFSALGERLTCYVNQARSTPQDCDGDGIIETPAPGFYLSYNQLLASAALVHAENLYANALAGTPYLGHFTDNLATAPGVDPDDPTDPNFFDANLDGFNDRFVTGRVSAKGYAFSALRENVASGQALSSAQRVVEFWMQSQGHCSNIMATDVSEVGGAFKSDGSLIPFYYWTLVLAKPAP